ncbi:MAG TPA: sodium:solute symporter family protein [Candidatus Hydrogenedentes bacterium]|nr:sodium:solute symporter family protein [Candidatus Hydrogenedentota bacterium]
MDLFTISAVLIYIMVVMWLAYRGYKGTRSAADYLLAGRNANPIVMALSYGATFISTSAIVGFGGVAATYGMSLLWLVFLNIFVGIFLAFVVFGGRTRRMGHHLGAHTFPEFLAKRYNSRFIQTFAAAIIFVFMPLYAMAVLRGGAEFISTTFDIPMSVSLLIFALVVVAYVIPSGIKGVLLTDALQGAIMAVGMIFLFVWTYTSLGGVVEAHAQLTGMKELVPPSLKSIGHQGWTAMPRFGWASPGTPPAEAQQYNLWWIVVSTIIMGVGIGVLAQPQLIVRFMTVKSQKDLNRAVVAGGLFIFLMVGVAYVVGALSNVYFYQHETIVCKVVDENVLLDPGEDGNGQLKPVPADADPAVKARAKTFVAYRLPEDDPLAAPRLVLKTPALKIERNAVGEWDELRPGLIAIARTISSATTMKGNVDRIIPLFIQGAMPKWFGVIFLLTLLSAAMSTLSGQMHTIGSALGKDLFEQFRQGNSIFLTRIGIAIGLLASLGMGYLAGASVIAVATAVFFGICAGTFLPAYLVGLYWKRPGSRAVIASMLAGFLTNMFWMAFVNAKTAEGLGIYARLFGKPFLSSPAWSATWNVVDPVVISVPVALVVLVGWALLDRPLDPRYADWCFDSTPSPPPADQQSA